MSKLLKYTFLVHAVVALIIGALLLFIPGRFLQWLGWAPIEPIVNRMLGAALLALAWSSFRGWRARERREVAILIEMELAFTVLACVGLLRHLLVAHYPLVVWLLFAGMAAFALAWTVCWARKT
ncbi:MAG: hypothetical protein JXA37_06170 [Chloroflexia bacterium]|nr:hypothetical protein [Chloroflexia bacterium]